MAVSQTGSEVEVCSLNDEERALLRGLAKAPAEGIDLEHSSHLVELGLAGPGDAGVLVITPAGRAVIARHHRLFFVRAPRAQPSLKAYRKLIATVADMQRVGWTVIAHCPSCDARQPIDLDLLAWRRGAKTILWGEAPTCPTPDCRGPAVYKAKLPGASHFRPLT